MYASMYMGQTGIYGSFAKNDLQIKASYASSPPCRHIVLFLTSPLKRHLTYTCSDAHCNTLQHTATHCSTLQRAVTHCNTLQHTATHCSTLQRAVTHCNTLQHTATHCNTLQHTAVHCNAQQHTATNYNIQQYTATRSNTLQHTATHCNTHFVQAKSLGSLRSFAKRLPIKGAYLSVSLLTETNPSTISNDT